MAPPASCRRAVGARVAGPRDAVRDVHQAEHAEGRPRSSRSPAGRPGRCGPGGAACASATNSSISGTAQPSMPTLPPTTVRTASPTLPGQVPPDRGGDHDGQADQGETGAVAAVRRVQVAGAVADAADDAAEQVRDADPALDQAAAESQHGGREGTGPADLGAAVRAAVVPLRFALCPRFWAPDGRERPPVADRSVLGRLAVDFRARAGEDVRVAISSRLPRLPLRSHVSHAGHTAPSVASQRRHAAALQAPVTPSSCSRSRSAWPQWRAYSPIRWR